MGFLVIPAVDMKGRKCVQLRQGDENQVIVEMDDPLAIANCFVRSGAPRIHVIDLDGAIGGTRVNAEILERMVSELEVPIQFGGGIRGIEDARRLLDMGVQKIILGTLALDMPEAVLRLAEEYGRERLTVALDSRHGKVLVKGWKEEIEAGPEEVVKKFERSASEVLFTNVEVEGLMEGVALEVIEGMVSSTSLGVIVSGGITTLEDVRNVRKSGAAGCVIGSALYTGKLDYRKALRTGGGKV